MTKIFVPFSFDPVVFDIQINIQLGQPAYPGSEHAKQWFPAKYLEMEML